MSPVELESIDLEALQRLQDIGGLELIDEVRALVTNSVGERLREVRSAVSTGDDGSALLHLHALKSSFGNVGAVGLKGLAETLYQEMSFMSPERQEELLGRIEVAWPKVLGKLETLEL